MAEPRMTIPDEIKDFVEVENCDDFNEAKYFLTQRQIDIIKDIVKAQKVTAEMHNLGFDYVNTTLLYGPPGTGKTTFARFTAKQLDIDFVYINFVKLMEGGIFGNTAANLTKVFDFVSENECLFMLDEIDYIATKRTEEGQSTGKELSRITTTLMQNLDICKKKRTETIIMAATNIVQNLDDALRSRFSIEREFPLLTNPEKEQFCIKYLKSALIPYNIDNIRNYVARNSRVTQRRMESDMQRAIAEWIYNDKEGEIEVKSITGR